MTEYITISEAAQIIGCSVSYVHILVKGRTRENGKYERPQFADVIRTDKRWYTWYVINKHEVIQFAKERKKWKESKAQR